MNKLKAYLKDETGSESTEKIITIGGAVILAGAAVAFITYQFNKGAKDGATKAGTSDISAPAQVKWDVTGA